MIIICENGARPLPPSHIIIIVSVFPTKYRRFICRHKVHGYIIHIYMAIFHAAYEALRSTTLFHVSHIFTGVY